MPQENVESVRKFFDAFSRGDLEAFLEPLTPEFEFYPSGAFPDTKSVYRGRQGVAEFWDLFHGAWESITISVERIEDLGEQVLLLGTFHAIGRESGVEVTRQSAWLQAFRDGLLVRNWAFASWAEALEAVGLSE